MATLEPFINDADFTLWVGDVREVLATLPAESIDCCVTSPPYWSLRDYGVEGQIGLESTWQEYVASLVEVFREVRRVMASHGTLWLNLGDCYSTGSSGERTKGMNHRTLGRPGYVKTQGEGDLKRPPAQLPPKNLIGLPWRVAFALQDDGWILRQEIIWWKPNVMPESVTDRPTRAHEQIFMFAKSDRCYFDREAVREPFVTVPQRRNTPITEQPSAAARAAAGGQNPTTQGGPHVLAPPQEETLPGLPGETPRGADGRRKRSITVGDGSHENYESRQGGERWPNAGRNIRSVWQIVTQSNPDAHFAMFPDELPRRCILAGCPERGVVLDPFMGSGTTARVARAHNRRCVGVELNPEYAALIAKATTQLSLLA